MLQELLTKNQINPSWSSHYNRLKRYYNPIKDELYKKTGLNLIQVENSYKLQIPETATIAITKNDTPLTYAMFLLIAAYLITKKVNEPFPQEELYEEIRFEMNTISDYEKEKLFKQVLKYMVENHYMASFVETTNDGETIKLLKKTKDAFVARHNPEQNKPTRFAQLANHLFLHQTINKLNYPKIFDPNNPNAITNEDLKEYFEQFHDDYNGYDVVFDGNIIRLISLFHRTSFPNMDNNKHKVLVDILEEVQKDPTLETIEALMVQSEFYRKEITAAELMKLIEEYDLLQLKIKKESW